MDNYDHEAEHFKRLERVEERYAAAVARYEHRHWLWKEHPNSETFAHKVRANMAACAACERVIRQREDIGRETTSIIKAEAARLKRIGEEHA